MGTKGLSKGSKRGFSFVIFAVPHRLLTTLTVCPLRLIKISLPAPKFDSQTSTCLGSHRRTGHSHTADWELHDHLACEMQRTL